MLKEEQEAELDIIKADYKDHKTCCKEMFWYWLRSNPNASWYHLIECLKSSAVELHALAADIENHFFTGTYVGYGVESYVYALIAWNYIAKIANSIRCHDFRHTVYCIILAIYIVPTLTTTSVAVPLVKSLLKFFHTYVLQ